MIFGYGTLINPEPISLSVGTLKKPKLKEIAEISFERFDFYKTLLKITPFEYYTVLLGDHGKEQWEGFTDDYKDTLAMYGLLCADEKLSATYCEMFDFFFVQHVIFKEGMFVILNDGYNENSELNNESVKGVIIDKTFMQAIQMIQQVCCIYEKEEERIENMKFKSELAKKMYEKMLKAKKEQEKIKAKKANKDFSLPNIISAVSNRHPTINPINVWELTVFQLIDAFGRLQVNALYDINWTRVSVWGDEKKTFDPSLWYKNNHD